MVEFSILSDITPKIHPKMLVREFIEEGFSGLTRATSTGPQIIRMTIDDEYADVIGRVLDRHQIKFKARRVMKRRFD